MFYCAKHAKIFYYIDVELSSFDCIIYRGSLETVTLSGILVKVLSLLKNGGVFAIADVADKFPKIEFELKVNGYINIKLNENGFLYCDKPNYEIGSSAKLNFKSKPVKAVWKIDDTIEDDMIDPDNLLDEDDLKKPDASSLKGKGIECFLT